MTTIYLIRHSKPLKVNNSLNLDNLQVQNEKQVLSIEGESIAKDKLSNNIFDGVDIIYSSNYVRTIQTAKYLAERIGLPVNVLSSLGERKFGITSWGQLSEDFEKKQLADLDYKIGDGESQREVRNRMYNAIMKIVEENIDKKVAVIGHSTAITYLLGKWCTITEDGIIFNNNMIFDNNWDYCETFKLDFDNNELISIENIKL